MIPRRQLAVASPISIRALFVAAGETLFGKGLSARASQLVGQRYAAASAVLTDSGTSALVVALRLAVGEGGTVAFPGYACVDLAAAAIRARVRVRLYDIDPATLSPDLESVERTLDRGATAIVVAHLFGYAADVIGIRAVAERRGVTVIEDAAQGAGGTLESRRLGSLGQLSVLSFGRGKGLCAGGGGALLAFDQSWTKRLDAVELPAASRGAGALATTAVQWALGRPAVYGIPSMIPGLHLGEMVYHPADEPQSMVHASCSLVQSALALEDDELRVRRGHAATLERLATRSRQLVPVTPIVGSASGFLRFAARDTSGLRSIAPALGVVQPYPRTLAEQPELDGVRVRGDADTPGATELRRSLFTLPTHRMVGPSDVVALGEWMEPTSSRRTSPG